MEPTSLDYLKKQVFYTGFGNVLDIKLELNTGKELDAFQETFSRDFGKDKATATLYFTRSERGQYFFNKYDLTVDKEDGKSVSHTFYVNNKAQALGEGEKRKSKTLTVKEAYNQLCGRFVLKTMDNKDGMETTAWRGIDFTERNENGRYKSVAYPSGNLDVGKSLTSLGYDIKELGDKKQAQELIQSLEKGDRVTVTLMVDGQEFRRPLVADPEFRQMLIDTPVPLAIKQSEEERLAKQQGESQDQNQTTTQEKGLGKDDAMRPEKEKKGIFKFLG